MKPEQDTPPQESPSWSLAPVAWLLVAVALPAALVWFDVGRAMPGEAGEHGAPTLDGSLPIAPRPEQALAEHRARVQEWLDSYGWIDRAAGVARVPIEEGMEAVLRAGLPVREEIEKDR